MASTSGCGNCEFAGQSVSAFDGEVRAKLSDDGSIIYASAAPSCGLGFGKVDAKEELETHYPEFLQRLADCEGPIEETTEVPRMWPLGSLGLVKEATVQRCAATNSDEMMQIISESRERRGVQQINLGEAYGN